MRTKPPTKADLTAAYAAVRQAEGLLARHDCPANRLILERAKERAHALALRWDEARQYDKRKR